VEAEEATETGVASHLEEVVVVEGVASHLEEVVVVVERGVASHFDSFFGVASHLLFLWSCWFGVASHSFWFEGVF
jgi:hypothetical protein